MDNGFIRIPCSLMSSRAWKNGNDKQRVAIVTLCSVVAYTEHVFHSKYGDVRLECGQMVTSIRALADMWDVTKDQARRIVDFLEKEQVITMNPVNEDAKESMTRQMARYSILTVNELHDSLTREVAQDIRRINKKDNKEKINN